MTHRVINVEEQIGRTVGRRGAPNGLAVRPDAVAEAEKWRTAFGGVRIPRGVFKFHSHEEADAWLIKHLTQVRT